jgi:rare lipoprotein A
MAQQDERRSRHRRRAIIRCMLAAFAVLMSSLTSLPATAAVKNGDEVVGQTKHNRKPPYRKIGLASWYGAKWQGRRTSSGDAFDRHELTAAHRTLPLHTRLRVTNLANGRNVEVKVSDRGPYKHHRIIDLSQAAAARIGLQRKGIGRVKIEVIPGQLES